jgi:ATP-binding protein involved in chromosome partitioning
MVGSVQTRRKRAAVELALPVAHYPQVEELEERIRLAVGSVPGVDEVSVTTVVMDEGPRARLRMLLRGEAVEGGTQHAADDGHDHGHEHGGSPLGHEEGRPNRFMLPRSKTRILGISSGKGGVGKSSVTVNLAVALARRGLDVGILDADVYGFSVPKMLGVTNDPLIIGDLVVPPTANGVRCLSMGYFVPDDTPVIWRGPMLHKALEQFLVDAYWGEPDYLLIDMPPGTGDVTLSLGQYLTKTEVYVVTTPQPAAERVAQRSAYAARKLKLAVRGVIENMSWFTGDDGKRYELFGAGGGTQLADELGVPLLAQVPLVSALRQGGDIGIPTVIAEPYGEVAKVFESLATSIIELGPARVYRKELSLS